MSLTFFNTVPLSEPGQVTSAVVLRCSHYLPLVRTPDWTVTNAELYHGSSFPDEIAALVSLVLGIRVRAGGVTRRFELGADPMGRPSDGRNRPDTGAPIRNRRQGWMLPNAVEGDHSLEWLSIMDSLPLLPVDYTVTLVRVARLYQDALWLVESQPALAWLLLISAAETAANQWRVQQDSPVDRLKQSKPDLYDYLESKGTEILSTVAGQIADSLGVTKKFVDFIIEFLPPPPTARPAAWCQYSWEAANVRKGMRLIYSYRSKALHDGRPFPAPMCEVPGRDAGWDAAQETPGPGFAVSMLGGIWRVEDLPMFFNTFEYIVRNALIAWWKKGIPQQNRTTKLRVN